MGSATLSSRKRGPYATCYDSDHLAPFGRCPDSLSKAERKIAMDTHQGTDMRSREILDWFFRVPGDNVEACCSGQSNMASGAQRVRVGVGKLEHD